MHAGCQLDQDKMGQYFVFANVTKSQSMHAMLRKAYEIVVNGNFQGWLPLFLLDLGNHHAKVDYLEDLCLKFLCDNDKQYTPSTLNMLPKSIQKKLDVTFLSGMLVGEWAGDRLITTLIILPSHRRGSGKMATSSVLFIVNSRTRMLVKLVSIMQTIRKRSLIS